MSKRYADQLERDFYEARVRQVGITARFGRDLTCFSLLVPAAHGACLQVLVHPGTSMHDNDNTNSLRVAIMHIAAAASLYATDEMEIARLVAASTRKKAATTTTANGPRESARTSIGLIKDWVSPLSLGQGCLSICGAIASFSCGFKF
jgi:hypothetical protein